LRWLEVQLTVEQELAEPIAELLARYTKQGIATQAEKPELVTITGWLEHDPQLPEHKKAFEEGLWHLSQINPIPEPSYKEVDDDWLEQWKSRYSPLKIGKRLIVAPPWHAPPSLHRQIISIEPGIAFGTGTHPTTQMCLDFLETVIQTDDRILDLGCGTGILAIAAVKLGASSALALDNDQQAISAAKDNIARNAVEDRVHANIGSLPEAMPGAPYDLVLANILSRVLLDMLQAGLAQLISPHGHVILSGILDDQVDDILKIANTQELQLVKIHMDQVWDWRALLLKKNTAA
jgi:ribosomal protein L11 methyltransferase